MNIPDKFIIKQLFEENLGKIIETDWLYQPPYYYNPQITFREVPDEISLTFPCLCYEKEHCSLDCNSKFCWKENWKDKLNILHCEVIEEYYLHNNGVTCITIMTSLCFFYLKNILRKFKLKYPGIKTCLYIGKDWEELIFTKDFREFDFGVLDYVKIGRFKKEYGPLDNPNTNQRFYKINHTQKGNIFECINEKFLTKI